MKGFGPIMLILHYQIILQHSNAQFPEFCMTPDNLTARECCPNKCGSPNGRGQCESITLPSGKQSVRDKWPYYFDRVCKCNGNFSGYKCGKCKYGHYGENCDKFEVIARRSISDYTPKEWYKYVKILEMTKKKSSGYKIFLTEPQPQSLPNVNDASDISLYDLFVWQHHYPAKDNENEGEEKKDYAHESTGFLTWHRQFLLWFEWEIQNMLQDMGEEDYYKFRIPYWDWRKEVQTETNSPFKSSRLGKTMYQDGFPQVQTDSGLFDQNWQTICWSKQNKNYDICDPRITTGQLQRCPLDESCSSANPLWPSDNEVQMVLSLQEYDTHPYDRTATNSFRNQLEGFKPLSADELQVCRDSKLCSCDDMLNGGSDPNCTENDTGGQPNNPIQRLLHNSIHIILGIGYFGSVAAKDMEKSGVMADIAASANDPIFLNHHAMVDCIFETWLQKNPNVNYPMAMEIPQGHRKQDYIVPFFPLFKHEDMLLTADNFGYSCEIKPHTPGLSWQHKLYIALGILGLLGLTVFIFSILIVCKVYCKRKSSPVRTEGPKEDSQLLSEQTA